jgi:hypothetical protein
MERSHLECEEDSRRWECKLELNARSNVVRRVAGYDSSLTCKCTDHSGPH